jgi:hypothetical protein
VLGYPFSLPRADGLTALETGLLYGVGGGEEAVSELLAAGCSPFVFERDGAWTTFEWDASLRTRRELRNRARPASGYSPWHRQPSELCHPTRQTRYGYWRVDAHNPSEAAVTALLMAGRAWQRRRPAVACCELRWDPEGLAEEAAARAAAAAARAAARQSRGKP